MSIRVIWSTSPAWEAVELGQTISFIEISIEAGILRLLGGKHEACFMLHAGGGRNWAHAVLTKLAGTPLSPWANLAKGAVELTLGGWLHLPVCGLQPYLFWSDNCGCSRKNAWQFYIYSQRRLPAFYSKASMCAILAFHPQDCKSQTSWSQTRCVGLSARLQCVC